MTELNKEIKYIIEKVFDNVANQEIEIWIGKNDLSNWHIIDISNQNDIWIHLKDVPSPHVIIKLHDIEKYNKQSIFFAASLCKSKSKYKNNKEIKAIYTEIKNVTKAEELGSVTTKKTKEIKI